MKHPSLIELHMKNTAPNYQIEKKVQRFYVTSEECSRVYYFNRLFATKNLDYPLRSSYQIN